MIQHFSEEQYIFYFAGETPEQAQVCTDLSLTLFLSLGHSPITPFFNLSVFFLSVGLDEMSADVLQ